MTQSEKDISFRVLNNGSSMQADRQVLERYFQLDVDFSELYSQWSATDDFIKTAAGNGVRILRQDPLETLVAFICSSNNNISRISLMMNRLCATYGQPVGEYADQTFYSFPSLKVLTSDKVEAKLRELGFGYRARYVAQAAVYVMAQSAGENWLTSLCDCSYQDAWTQLQQIPGVGPKVMHDCIITINRASNKLTRNYRPLRQLIEIDCLGMAANANMTQYIFDHHCLLGAALRAQ